MSAMFHETYGNDRYADRTFYERLTVRGLLTSTDGLQCEKAVFEEISKAVADLGFEHCAYGLRTP